jgi:secreted trypsin-like serine protease
MGPRGRAGIAALALALTLCAGLAATAVASPGQGGPVAGKSIIAGGKADPAKWRFMATVLRKGRLHCGGSIIAPTKILTAAHCVEGFKATNLDVVVGRPRLTDPSVGQVIDVVSAVPHPDYVDNQRHDVGVITLAQPTTEPPIELATVEESNAFTQPGQRLRVAGWGARNPFGFNLATVLKRTTEQIRTNKRCRRVYRALYTGRSMICALGRRVKRFGRPVIHTTGCSGDSGGPLVADTPLGPREVGTVSYGGAFCGLSSAPTVYSRTSDSLGFIAAQLAG